MADKAQGSLCQLPSCLNPAPSLPGWAPSTPLLLYQEEAVLPKHLAKTLKLSGYCYISRSSCPAPSLEPRTYTPPHSCSHLLDHSDNTGGGKAGWAWWKAAQHQCQHGTNMRPAEVSGEGCIPAGTRGRCWGPRGCLHFRV